MRRTATMSTPTDAATSPTASMSFALFNFGQQFVEQVKCCICLDIYRDPVSIPCGHNFCIDCIEGYWETKGKPDCPLCKEAFDSHPELRINHGFADIIDYLKSLLPNGEEDAGQKDEVLCDVCRDINVPAFKSCLVCQASYCKAHLEPHLQDTTLQRHRLTDPATFSTSHLCRNHNEPLEMFCKKDHIPVCARCLEREHRHHQTVPLDKASKKVKVALKQSKDGIQEMIQARLHKAHEIQLSVDTSKKMTEKEIQSSVQVCTMLISTIEQQQKELVRELQRRQEEVEKRAEELLNELQKELKVLQARGSELLKLENTQSPLHLLQSFPLLGKLPPTRDWPEVKVYSDNGTGAVTGAVSKMVELCQKLSDKLLAEEVEKLNQYAVDVTLDPATASGWLELSSDGKKVNLSKKKVPVTDNAKRFDSCVCVLGKETFKSGRHYWVVQVGDKTDWDLGLARESVNRKGAITVRPDCGFWAICRRKGGSLSACTSPSQTLTADQAPHKVGIFLDYEEGVVSFYNADTKKLLYTFTDCDLAGPVCPYFNPCVQDNGKAPPLVICPAEKRTSGEGPRPDLIMRTTL